MELIKSYLYKKTIGDWVQKQTCPVQVDTDYETGKAKVTFEIDHSNKYSIKDYCDYINSVQTLTINNIQTTRPKVVCVDQRYFMSGPHCASKEYIITITIVCDKITVML